MFSLSQLYALKLHNVGSFAFVPDSKFLHNSITSRKMYIIFQKRINDISKNVQLVQKVLLQVNK